MRHQIRAEIASIEPLDGLEQQHIADTLAWIDSGAELCRLQKPATPPRHLVSYFVLVDDHHVLLVDHRNAKLWLPTGGHVESGEHPRDAVLRELREELGVVCPDRPGPPLMITCTTTVGLSAGHTDVSLWYVLRGDRACELAFDEAEFKGVRWFPFAEVPLDRTDPHLGRFLRKLGEQSGRDVAGTGRAA